MYEKLKEAGFFREFGHDEPDSPSLNDGVGKLTDGDVQKIITYLYSGVPLIVTPGAANDVLSDDVISVGPPHIMTDGVWVWRRDLAYYVENYRVELPETFIEHMKKQRWKIGEIDTLSLM